MFKKVLIAEDHEIANLSIQKTLLELGVRDAKYVYYCDDAIAWLRNAVQVSEPYDLLITDLFFEEDHNRQRISGGLELIKLARVVQPRLKIIVFSAESRPHLIGDLFHSLAINGYVRKARHDAQHLKAAIQTVYNNRIYQSPDIKRTVREKNAYEFTKVDIAILHLLAQGVLQKDIPHHLHQQEIKPSGLSSVEKRLNLMKDVLEFTKNEQLIAYCKDIGVI